MVQHLSNAGPQAAPVLTTGIRIDVDAETDGRLDAWAEREGRSKREHVRYLVRQLLESYDKDPLILHRIALLREGAARVIPA